MTRLAVLVSGTGTNLQALIDAVREGTLDAEICLVASNRKRAYGIVRAEIAKIPTLVRPSKGYKEQHGEGWRAIYDAELAAQVARARPDLVVLAGWMHVLTPAFLDHFPGRVLNLHPALPGHFAGTNAIARAFEAFGRGEVQQTGVMVHWVVPEVDAGPVIASAEVPIYPDDTLEQLEERVHATEHQLIVLAVRRAIESTRR